MADYDDHDFFRQKWGDVMLDDFAETSHVARAAGVPSEYDVLADNSNVGLNADIKQLFKSTFDAPMATIQEGSSAKPVHAWGKPSTVARSFQYADNAEGRLSPGRKRDLNVMSEKDAGSFPSALKTAPRKFVGARRSISSGRSSGSLLTPPSSSFDVLASDRAAPCADMADSTTPDSNSAPARSFTGAVIARESRVRSDISFAAAAGVTHASSVLMTPTAMSADAVLYEEEEGEEDEEVQIGEANATPVASTGATACLDESFLTVPEQGMGKKRRVEIVAEGRSEARVTARGPSQRETTRKAAAAGNKPAAAAASFGSTSVASRAVLTAPSVAPWAKEKVSQSVLAGQKAVAALFCAETVPATPSVAFTEQGAVVAETPATTVPSTLDMGQAQNAAKVLLPAAPAKPFSWSVFSARAGSGISSGTTPALASENLEEELGLCSMPPPPLQAAQSQGVHASPASWASLLGSSRAHAGFGSGSQPLSTSTNSSSSVSPAGDAEVEVEGDMDPTTPGGASAHGSVKSQAPEELTEKKLAQRQHQIDIGKSSPEYLAYLAATSKEQRKRGDPQTPDRYLSVSKRRFEGLVKVWRRSLHAMYPQSASPTESAELSGRAESESVVPQAGHVSVAE